MLVQHRQKVVQLSNTHDRDKTSLCNLHVVPSNQRRCTQISKSLAKLFASRFQYLTITTAMKDDQSSDERNVVNIVQAVLPTLGIGNQSDDLPHLSGSV